MNPIALTAKQQKLLAALLTEVTIAAASKSVGISEVTAWRYLQDMRFQAAYQQARRQIVADSVGLLQRASKIAVEALVRNLNCDHPAVEVSAARAILDQAFRGVELLELEERMSRMEQELEEHADAMRNRR